LQITDNQKINFGIISIFYFYKNELMNKIDSD
jgi:hypothetical protein